MDIGQGEVRAPYGEPRYATLPMRVAHRGLNACTYLTLICVCALSPSHAGPSNVTVRYVPCLASVHQPPSMFPVRRPPPLTTRLSTRARNQDGISFSLSHLASSPIRLPLLSSWSFLGGILSPALENASPSYSMPNSPSLIISPQ